MGVLCRQDISNSRERIKSALSTVSSTSSRYLEPPPVDIRPDMWVGESDEELVDMRRRNQQTIDLVMGRAGVSARQSPVRSLLVRTS